MAREQQLAVELEQRELQAREDKEAWEAQAEAKRKLVQLQRWLPKGMIKMSAVAPELDLEVRLPPSFLLRGVVKEETER